MMLLLVLGTLYQTDFGIFRAQQLIFSSWLFVYPLSDMGFGVPLPGARLLMFILFVNLLFATVFRLRWRRHIVGVYIVHAGILVLLSGGFLTAYFSHEGAMKIAEGEASNYSTRYYEKEIAITHRESPEKATVTAIRNFIRLRPGTMLTSPDIPLPFRLELRSLFRDAVAIEDRAATSTPELTRRYLVPRAIHPLEKPSTEAEFVAGVFTVHTATGAETFILADTIDEPMILEIDGDTYEIQLRGQRDYYPFSIYLEDFRRETYPGSPVNRSFESHVIFVDPVRELERGVRIYMNHPLRHRLLTFYQSSFDRNDTVTVLSVVRNTGLVVPYVATVVIALGLLIQFITLLVMRRRRGL